MTDVLQISEVHADHAGRVFRNEWDGRVYFHAAGRCIGNYRGDDFDYHVSVGEWPHFPTLEEAREAISTWEPRWPMHAHDHRRALRQAP